MTCKKCNCLCDVLINNYCYMCLQDIKNNNPSSNENIYYFNEIYFEWMLHQKKCERCNYIKTLEHFEFNNIICNNCQLQKELEKIKKHNNDIDFMILDNKIKGRKICPCGSYTDWINKFYVIKNHVLRCKNCNPSFENIKKYWGYVTPYQLINVLDMK